MSATASYKETELINESVVDTTNENSSTEIESLTENETAAEIRRQEADVLLKEENNLTAKLEQLRETRNKLSELNASKCESETKQIEDIKKRNERYLNKKKALLEEKKTRQQSLLTEKNCLIEKAKQIETNLSENKRRDKDLQNAMKQTESNLKDLIAERNDATKKFRQDYNELKRSAKDRRKKDTENIASVRKVMRQIEMDIAKRIVVRKALEYCLPPEHNSVDENE